MARIHNQSLLEKNITRCDTLSLNVIEKRDQNNIQKRILLETQKGTREALYDYVFGRSDENPFESLTAETDAFEAKYLMEVDFMIQETLNSRN